MKLTIRQTAYHRNGVSGEGFHVVTFSWDNPETGHTHHMVGTVFDEQGQCAVFDIDELTKDNIAFAKGNSWRGDNFEPELRVAIERFREEQDRRIFGKE